MNPVSTIFKDLYVFVFARKTLYRFNMLMYKLSMRGIGIMNHENDRVSGEEAFVKYMKKHHYFDNGVILDVGANVGHYSVMLRRQKVSLPIYAFEPHPKAFNKLQDAAAMHHFIPVRRGAGDKVSQAVIYDYAGNGGSEHASMYKEVITGFRDSEAEELPIDITTIDDFVAENHISEVALLKIDTEGHELNVLRGAMYTIQSRKIKVIQIEFNEMNVISRTFFKDFIDLLPDYSFYRMLPDGLMPLGHYNVAAFEIFAFQNIVAILK